MVAHNMQNGSGTSDGHIEQIGGVADKVQRPARHPRPTAETEEKKVALIALKPVSSGHQEVGLLAELCGELRHEQVIHAYHLVFEGGNNTYRASIPSPLQPSQFFEDELDFLATDRAVTREYAPPPAGMVLVPAGNFIMGSDDPKDEPDEHPRRIVFLDAFCIDRFEVTNREYTKVVPGHTYPDGEDDFPVTGLVRNDVLAYAHAVGKRLPTKAEWEKAARGTAGRIYPWGDVFIPGNANVPASARISVLAVDDPSRCLILPGKKKPVGSFPAGVRPYGAYDMAGDVWEWVSDNHRPRGLLAGCSSPPARGILRGGAYGYGPNMARTSYQGFEDPNCACNDTGFRCAKDTPPK